MMTKNSRRHSRTNPWLGHLYKRGKVYYLELGERDADGRKVRLYECLGTTIKEEAERKAIELTDPLRFKKESGRLEHWLYGRISSAQNASAVSIRIADAWQLHPYDTAVRGERRPLRPACIRDNEQTWMKFVKWMAATYPDRQYMEQVDEAMAKAYSTHNRRLQIGARGHNLRMIVCRVMFDLCEITPNPFRYRNWKLAENRISRKTLPPEQEKRILELATGELRTLVIIGMCTGMRLGDCCMLEWEHVAEGRVIKRTSKCQRDVSLAIHPLLAQELACLPRNGRYVIPGIAALYKRKAANVSIKVRKLFELAGVQVVERVEGRKKAVSRRNFHCLRHTFITTCARAGVPKTLISSWIGHSPVVDEIYQQWDQKERDTLIMAAQESRLSSLVPVRELNSAKPENAKASEAEVTSAKARLHQLVDSMPEQDASAWLEKMNIPLQRV